jgi:hypothetical protein
VAAGLAAAELAGSGVGPGPRFDTLRALGRRLRDARLRSDVEPPLSQELHGNQAV